MIHRVAIKFVDAHLDGKQANSLRMMTACTVHYIVKEYEFKITVDNVECCGKHMVGLLEL
jgi:hypothetical protein